MVDILHRVGILSDPKSVHAALTTVDGIRGWWKEGSTGDASRDGAFTFKGGTMHVLEDSPELVRWNYTGPAEEWVGTEVSFRLRSTDDQTEVLFRHSGWRKPTELMHHCSTKWATFLLSLKSLLETGEGHPSPRDVKISAFD